MSDGHRAKVVDHFVPHHSVGPEYENATKLTIQDAFDRVGKSRAYSKLDRSFHKHPQRNQDTFAQAGLALHKYTKDGNKYGWRLVELMDDVWNNVAWHAGNWDINTRSIGVEVCGNYSGKKLPEKALMLLADYLRPHDVKIGGILTIRFHYEFQSTSCPGMIREQKKTWIDMMNDPKKWNDKLWPVEVIDYEKMYNDLDAKLDALNILHNETIGLLGVRDTEVKTLREKKAEILKELGDESDRTDKAISDLETIGEEFDVLGDQYAELLGKMEQLEDVNEQLAAAALSCATLGELLKAFFNKVLRIK